VQVEKASDFTIWGLQYGMDTMTAVKFGDWLVMKLGQRDVSARRFALAIGVSAQSASTWIKGESYPTRDKLPLIAEYFGVHLDEVWDAYRETPTSPYTDVTLARLLDLPDDLRQFEVIFLKHLMRAMRAAEAETEERGMLARHRLS
jgi:transcriptional regulator with XRE-family HTH domain